MEFKINWFYPIQRNERAIFPQICKLKEDYRKRVHIEMPPFCAGIYISNLINACNVEKTVDGYRSSEAFEEWRKIAGEDYFRQNDFDGNINYILYDSIAFPALCIFENIKTTLEEINTIFLNDGNEHFSRISERILGSELCETLLHEHNESIQYYQDKIQYKFDKYIDNYNRLLMSATMDIDDNFYWELYYCLIIYNGPSKKLIKQYLKDKGGRCFATFIKRNDGKKYISFSGFLDATDCKILNWIGKNKPEDFVDTAKAICRALGAQFVPINLNTRRYHVRSPLPYYIEQGLSIDDLINCGYSYKNYRPSYSCCERKIFGYFNDYTPDGTLYVKMKTCTECALGIIYQWSVGHTIILHDGLNC
ncbi:MAG: hypothetical protein K2K12_02685 [Clostridia bacterium]|nr:hypothetical protein [Clostridia bacterium]